MPKADRLAVLVAILVLAGAALVALHVREDAPDLSRLSQVISDGPHPCPPGVDVATYC